MPRCERCFQVLRATGTGRFVALEQNFMDMELLPTTASWLSESEYTINEMVYEGLINHFVDCILGLAKPTCGGRQQLHVHEILFKGYEAAGTGRAQDLETTFTPWHQISPAFLDTRSRPI